MKTKTDAKVNAKVNAKLKTRKDKTNRRDKQYKL